MKLSITKKLYLGFGIISFLLFLFGVLVTVLNQRNTRLTKSIINIDTPSSTLLNDYKTEIIQSKSLIKTWVYIDKKNDTPDKKELKYLIEKKFPQLQSSLKVYSKKWNEVDSKKLIYVNKVLNDTILNTYKEIMSKLNNFDVYDDPMIMFEIQPMLDDEGETIILLRKLIDNVTKLSDKFSKRAKLGNIDILENSKSFSTIMIFVVSFFIIIAIILTILLSKSITKPIKKLHKVIVRMSKGELPDIEHSNVDDEIGQIETAMQTLVKKLEAIISNIKSSTSILTQMSGSFNSKTKKISESASNQASSVEEVSASLEQMVSNIEQNTENAQTAELIVKNAVQEIDKNNDNVQKSVNALQEISEKITIINDIAFQTNILSLNASIEAARAGNAGKGFGVVAYEIGKLAEKSKESSEVIEELSLSSIEISRTTGESSEALIPEINKTENLVNGISIASKELSNGVNQISLSVEGLNKISQENAAYADEISRSSNDLARQARMLDESVSFFKISDDKSTKNSQSINNNQNQNVKGTKTEPYVKNEIKNNAPGFNMKLPESDSDDFEMF